MRHVVITSFQPDTFPGNVWWALTHWRSWWRGETMTTATIDDGKPAPKSVTNMAARIVGMRGRHPQ